MIVTDICVIAIDTTGLYYLQDEILEIGIIRIDRSRKIIGKFSSLVWPGETAFQSPNISWALNKRKRKRNDFLLAPSPEKIANAALAFLGNWKTTQIISFHVPFTRGFLRRKPWDRIGNGYRWPINLIDMCSKIMGEADSPHCQWSNERNGYEWPSFMDAIDHFGIQHDFSEMNSVLDSAEVVTKLYLKILEHRETPHES